MTLITPQPSVIREECEKAKEATGSGKADSSGAKKQRAVGRVFPKGNAATAAWNSG